MKATEQYFPVVLFIMLYKVVLSFKSVDEFLKRDLQMKATEQYFPVVLFSMLYKVVSTFKSVGAIRSFVVVFLYSCFILRCWDEILRQIRYCANIKFSASWASSHG